MENLPIEVMLILGVLSSVIVWILKVAFVDKGKEIPVWVYSIVLGVVALGLAVVFSPVTLPPFPPTDGSLIGYIAAILTYAGALVPVLAAIVGTAKIIYEALLKRILDGLEKKLRRILGSNVG